MALGKPRFTNYDFAMLHLFCLYILIVYVCERLVFETESLRLLPLLLYLTRKFVKTSYMHLKNLLVCKFFKKGSIVYTYVVV